MDKNKKQIIYTILVVVIIIVACFMFWRIYIYQPPVSFPEKLKGDMTYLDGESTTQTSVFEVTLTQPEKSDFDEVIISVYQNTELIEDFTYNFTDINSNSYFDSGDKISITLNSNEYWNGKGVAIMLNNYLDYIFYEFD